MRRLLLASAVVVFFGLLAGEIGARWLGTGDLPIFQALGRGYIPAPSQHGTFLRKNAWAFNDRSMGVYQRYHWSADAILLVGDSVVYGGNPLRQDDKLGPVMSRDLHRPVWPLSAGGWALENELQAVLRNPDLLKMPTIVWISNSGDYGEEERWRNRLSFPDHHPVSVLLYDVLKYVLKPRDTVVAQDTPRATARWHADLQQFLSAYHGRLIWVLYPNRAEVGRHVAIFDPLVAALKGRAQIVDLETDSAWRDFPYRDGIHPTGQGDYIFARELAKAVKPQSSF